MKALTVRPGVADSLEVVDIDVPSAAADQVVVEGVSIGVCGTDHELNGGHYGWAPPGRDRLTIGHESLGRVVSAPQDSGFAAGDLVAGVVRRPDPVPCAACAHGEFDMCRNGEYTERGIKQRDGFGSQTWVIEPQFLVKLDPTLGATGVLMEPTSVVAKAWDQIQRVGSRAFFDPQVALVTGAGPVGLLAALLGVQRGLQVHVLDVVTSGLKPDLVAQLGASYHHGDLDDLLTEISPDIIIETTGAGALLAALLRSGKPYEIVCLLGMHDPQAGIAVDLASTGKGVVLDNGVVIGSVNANLDHWKQAADALAKAPRAWLERLITRTVPLSEFAQAFDRRPDDVKVVIDLQR